MIQGGHSAILSTFIKLPFVITIFVLSNFEWPFYTGFTVQSRKHKSLHSIDNYKMQGLNKNWPHSSHFLVKVERKKNDNSSMRNDLNNDSICLHRYSDQLLSRQHRTIIKENLLN